MNEAILDLRPGAPRALVTTTAAIDMAAMLRDRLFAPAALFVSLCLALGGARAGGVAPNAVLQMVAVALLLWQVLERDAPASLPAQRAALGFMLAGVGLALVQLVPLPPLLWQALPGRDFVGAGYALLGIDTPWLPLSLQPERTVAVLLALLPPLTVLVLALRLSREARTGVVLLVVAGALGSALLGAAQVAVGVMLRPYAASAAGVPAGVFAAVADQGVLALLALPCLAAATARQAARVRHDARARRLLALSATVAALLVAAAAATRAAAVLTLLPLALAASTAIALSPRWRRWRLAAFVLAGAGIGAVAAVLAWPADAPVATPAVAGWEAARLFVPAGAGLGTFAALSGMVTPIETLTRAAPAHADSDLAELMLEGGVAAALLLALFVGWWARQAAAAWRASGAGAPLRQAGALLIALALLASVSGAPLRTAGLAAVAALGLALLADHPLPAPEPPRRRKRR